MPGYEIHAVDDPGSIRMDRLTDDRSGCSRQGAARQAANNRGAVRQVRFYDFTPAGTNSGRGDFCFWLLGAAVPFRRYGCRARKPYASSLAAGERRPRKCRVNAAMIPGMISAMTPAMMAHAVMPAPAYRQDRRRGITSLLRPVRRRCFRRHRPVRRCSCRRCGSTWQCVSPRRSVCRSGS